MIVTEDEAKTVRCQESFGPYYVTPDGGDQYKPTLYATSYSIPSNGAGWAAITGGALPTVAAPSHCIGSKCMAWRWHNRTLGEAVSETGRGYCGKAGTP